METYAVHFTNLDKVLESLCEVAIVCFDMLPFKECKEIFLKDHKMNDADEYIVTDEGMSKYCETLRNIMIDRTLHNMVNKGLLEMSHDGTDFCFKATEKGLKAVDGIKGT